MKKIATLISTFLIGFILVINSLVLSKFILQNRICDEERRLSPEHGFFDVIEDLSHTSRPAGHNARKPLRGDKWSAEILRWCEAGAFIVSSAGRTDNLLKQIRRQYGKYCIIIPSIEDGYLIYISFEKDSVYLSYSEVLKAFPKLKTLSLVKKFRTARRNLAFLFAIQCGANFIFEIDSTISTIDTQFYRVVPKLQSPKTKLDVVTASDSAFINPHILFRPKYSDTGKTERYSWPRGFPLFIAGKSQTYSKVQSTLGTSKTVLFISLIDKYPDVDYTIPSLNRKISFGNQSAVIGLRSGTIAPFGSKAVLWTKPAYPFLYLPVTVNERYVDIIRSYITQRLFVHFNYTLSFLSPIVSRQHQPLPGTADQVRSIFQSHQEDLSFCSNILNITNQLFRRWAIKHSNNFEKTFLSLFGTLYDERHIPESELLSSKAWIQDVCAFDKKLCPSLEMNRYGRTKPITHGIDTSFENPLDHDTHNAANVAVCVSGQLRSLNLSITDRNHPRSWHGMRSSLPPPNTTVAETIQKVLYPKLGTPDVFVVVSSRETPHEPKVGDLNACEPLRPPKGYFSCSIRRESNVNISYESELWDEFLLAKESRNGTIYIQGLLQQLKGMYECYQEIERYSTQKMKRYDWIVRLRPDSYFLEFPTLSDLTSQDSSGNVVWYASRKHCCCGNEDSFGIGPENVMRAYLERFVHLQQVPFALGQRWNAEKFLQLYLESKGMALRENPNMHVCKVKPLSRKGRSSP